MISKRNLVFLGPPGAGKGTIAQILSESEGLVHISTGEIFRNEIKNETELGKKAKEFVTSGGLVPDDLVAEMVASRLSREDCDGGFILDGFPRTLPQADLFAAALKQIGRKIDLVVYFKAGEELLLKRLTSRIICKQCGTNFNLLFMPPKIEGVCDKCGGELYQRPDDSLETVKERLTVYEEQTTPLIGYYQKMGILAEVDGSLKKELTTPLVMEVVS